MKEKRNFDLFAQRRLDAMISAHSRGLTSSEELVEAARMAEQRAIEEIGAATENRFLTFSKMVKSIKEVRNGTPQEDVYRGIDKWVIFKRHLNLLALPVQIKSSDKDVRKYKYGDPQKNTGPNPGFIKLQGVLMVINCGPSVKPEYFKKQIYLETRRIRNILEVNPSLADLIKR